jgi:hypothetical protein
MAAPSLSDASTAELLGLAEASPVSVPLVAAAAAPAVVLDRVVEAGVIVVVGVALLEAGVAVRVAVIVISVAVRSSVPASSHVSSVPVRVIHDSVDASVSIEQEAV